jgi:hypothetical protein
MGTMTSRRIDAEIDRLYQLAPDEFTPARNALAKEAGSDAPEVRKLAKPPLPAWAINQLFWRRRPVYDALIGASNELRQDHKAVLNGRQADLRTAGKTHETALDGALKGALAILEEQGHPATDATRQAILTTLRALPADEPPGRLTRTLQPGGFEMLAGLSIAPGKGAGVRPKPEAPAATKTPAKTVTTKAEKAADARARAQAAEAAAKAARELRHAEHTARREEFEAARAARDAEKAIKQLEEAKEALQNAQHDLKAAEVAAANAGRARDTAERRAKEAERALEAARKKL